MKNVLRAIGLTLAFGAGATAQQTADASVEKSIFNIQTGFLGLYANNELGLSSKFALRTEIGLDAGFSVSAYDNNWGLIPMINVEPRYYYNITKRAAKGRNISGNAANFITLTTRLNPGIIVYASNDNAKAATSLLFAPKWGIRRNIGNSNFNYEAGIGIGYFVLLGEDKKYYADKEGVGLDLHLRIGYTF